MWKSVLVQGVVGLTIAACVTGCGLFDDKHEVGECVKTTSTLGGTDIETVPCPTDSSAFNSRSVTDPTYRITEVLDIDGHCSPGEGWGGIELKHEPDDAVYCLELIL